MNKLGKRQYIKLIAETLSREYGNTLVEYDTDIKMAKAVLKQLTKYLYFGHDMSQKEFSKWRKDLYIDIGMDESPDDKQEWHVSPMPKRSK